MRQPELILHADWSKAPRKRWCATAALDRNDCYWVEEPERVGALSEFFHGLQRRAGISATALTGFDFPIGLPKAYALKAGLDDFRGALGEFGEGRWQNFYVPATTRDEIAITRPFYPERPGGTRQQDLVDGLDMSDFNDLLRRCEVRPGRRPACALFWILGPNQVGRGTIAGWRDLIGPAASQRTSAEPDTGKQDGSFSIWPFDGELDELLERPGIVVAETYPAEVYHHLGLDIRKQGRRKTRREDRAADAPRMHRWVRDNPVRLTQPAHAAIDNGFGNERDGDDRFDAMVGVFGMLDVVLGNRPPGAPEDESTRIEGWILGQCDSPAPH